MNCNLCFKLVRSLYHTHLWSGWCSQLLVNNLRLVWIQKHYTKGYTKNRVQDLIFVPYHLQNQMNEIEGKTIQLLPFLSMWYLKVILKSNQCQKYWNGSLNILWLWPHLFLIALSLDLHVKFWLLFLIFFGVLIPVLRLCGISLYYQLLNLLREYFLFSYA